MHEGEVFLFITRSTGASLSNSRRNSSEEPRLMHSKVFLAEKYNHGRRNPPGRVELSRGKHIMPRKYSYYISRSIEIPARALFLFQVTGRGKSKIANDFQDHRSILTDINWFFNDHQKLFFISFGISSSVEINRAIREQSRSILSSNSFFFFSISSK